jgi:hypothetical protein
MAFKVSHAQRQVGLPSETVMPQLRLHPTLRRPARLNPNVTSLLFSPNTAIRVARRQPWNVKELMPDPSCSLDSPSSMVCASSQWQWQLQSSLHGFLFRSDRAQLHEPLSAHRPMKSLDLVSPRSLSTSSSISLWTNVALGSCSKFREASCQWIFVRATLLAKVLAQARASLDSSS